jgi:transposase
LREKSGKSSGGQAGHKGNTLKQVALADEVVEHEMKMCPRCSVNLTEEAVTGVIKRQVFDVPEPQLWVTEHQAQIKCCPDCAATVMASFPPGVAAPTQYGSRIKALSVYLHQQQMIPEDRLAELFQDVFALRISTATLTNYNSAFAQKITPLTEQIWETLRTAPVKNLDESGLRVEAKLHWMHVMSNDEWTHYRVTQKRGDIPRGLTGNVVHDHFKPYYTPGDVTHSLCGAHHLRELKGMEEIEKEPWAKLMSRLLKLACHLVNQGAMSAANAIGYATGFPPARERRYGECGFNFDWQL